ncbi:alpha-2-macroglobulin [Massilia sp. Root418]|uniref:alpha-2-macroglobulin family protein n=1 Tax=Massilia sp. Root418 TaxID=1736532 RepID=UPI0006FAE1CD|nr:MG2 domain-containing protein [Massilia sp. Root418]KQW97214.1 alpha-2-macroglobulin [Massilia sp. Root418]
MRALSTFAVLCLLPFAAHAQTAVEAFSPQDAVKGVRQVKVRFSAQMVPFGDLRLADPFDADCGGDQAAAGKGRWVDGRNWVYDFERDLPAGVACRFTLKSGLADVAGKPLAGERSYSFNTGGPSVAASMPRDGAGYIDENQTFLLSLDAVPREGDIARHAYCTADGINEKIPVRLLEGKERQQVLDARKDYVQRHLHLFWAARGVVWHSATAVKSKRAEQMPVSVLQCQRSLPQNARVTLVWGAAIAAPNGIANQHDQVLAFKTRPDFTAAFSCERPSAKGQCIPFQPVRVNFSAPVRIADARAVALTGPGGKRWAPQFAKEEAKAEYVSGVTIPGPFPEKARLRLVLPDGLKDDAGRSLLNQARFPLAVQTGDMPPLVKFPARFGIIEARGDKLLPVTVRNVEAGIAARMAGAAGAMLRVDGPQGQQDQQDRQVIDWLRRLSGKNRNTGWVPGELWGLKESVFAEPKGRPQPKTERFTLPKPGGGKAFEVIGIPLRKPGFYVVELASPKLGLALQGKPSLAYVSAGALVTNMVAHFKRGAESSLVWVTSLDKGQPVPNAQVAVRACTGKLLWQGRTDAMGVASISEELFHDGCPYNEGYFVSARSGADMTFTLSNWAEGIEPWRFNVPTEDLRADKTIASTVFDRTLLRAGETVHMKHFLRRRSSDGIAYAAPQGKDGKLVILHQGSDQKYELPLAWANGGVAESSWTIPADAKQGTYQVMFDGRVGGSFRVEQFRVPTMKALLQGPSAPVVQAAQVALDVQLSYLSGGGAAGAQVRLRTTSQARSVHFEEYDDFSFAAGDVKAGKVAGAPAFDEDEGEFESMEGEAGADGAPLPDGPVRTQNLTLDRAGGARVVVDKLPALEQPATLLAEMSYQDANGETLTSSTGVPLWPSGVVIGIKPDSWVLSKTAVKFQVAVLDTQGKPVAGAPVEVDFFQRLSYSHRRRLIGGFYAYENNSEIKALGKACEGKTDAKGLLICEVAAPEAGNLILRAQTQDGQQRVAVTNRETWVADGDNWWFKASDDDRIDLLPERKRYEPGETATFQLRMPFREATALITVEREGILDTYVRPLSGAAPVFSIPVKPNYAPNMFVSALVVRGRVAGVQPTALVDLGKPAYKMGVAQLRVGWAAHELKVAVKTDREVYKVREKAQVKVKVTRADGSAVPAGAEVALAAVDVGLLELMPNASWDLLEAMMQQRGLQVETATAQMQVVGKRHFGRKAVPHGGGGGKGGGRELFDTLLFWKARVKLDANGEASVQVPVNDSLTAFRIVAVASANADLFGTGRAEIRSAQDLMLLSGLPAVVREGDKFRAGFTLRNASARDLKVELGAQVSGKVLPRQRVAIAAGMAQEVGWDYQVPVGVTELAWDVTARIDGTPAAGEGEGEGGAPSAPGAAGASSDRLRLKQAVKAAVPVRTLQATLLQLDKPQSMQVQMPADALPGRGGVQTLFASRLGSELPGVRDYMQAYPYTCFEQNTSRAIALRDGERWQKLAAQLPAYLDSDGLLKYFPIMEQGSDTLTAYVLSAVQEAGFPIPPELKARMEDALLNFVQGRITRGSPLATADLAVRKLAALEALSRVGRVGAGDLESFSPEPNLWPTSAVIDWYLIHQRVAQLPERDKRLAQAQQILRSRLNLQGTTMGFSTERNDDWWWLMVSGDVNANRLLLAMTDNPGWQPDIGRLARGALGRQHKGHWNTTVANAWGVLALDKFSDKFEREPVMGSSTASIGNASKSVALDAAGASGSALLPWPRGASELSLRHAGSGKPWVTVQSLAAVPLKAPITSGYKIVKTITPVEQAVKGAWTRGDVYRVRLDLEAQADMTWVVVDDPIPASASVLGTGLGKDSQLLTAGEKGKGWVWPAFQERTFEAFRSYYEYVPKGKWSVEYTVRLNNAGQFQLPPTRVEAMYSPEAFAELPNAAVSVK